MTRGWTGLLCSVLFLAVCTATPSFTAGAADNNPVRVQIEIPKDRYTVGEPFSFTLKSTRDCHFIVFTIDASDHVELHDPSTNEPYMGSPILRAGEVRTVPVSGAPGRAIITPPTGPYEIGAVCGRDQLAAYGLDSAAMVTPAQSGRRGFKFFLDKAVGGFNREGLSLITVTFSIEN